jgi:rhodanese-related sulfurtransferase
MASHEAAREAAKLGYKNLFVMTDGISGWVKAGKPGETGGT